MAQILWALVAIGGPLLIAAAVIYGILTHRTPPPRGITTPPDGKDM